jgi:hypothetical protein
MLCAALALLLFWVQDIDSIVLKNSERFSLVSQITDPREAEAFLAIRRATDPAARYHLASEFLKLIHNRGFCRKPMMRRLAALSI